MSEPARIRTTALNTMRFLPPALPIHMGDHNHLARWLAYCRRRWRELFRRIRALIDGSGQLICRRRLNTFYNAETQDYPMPLVVEHVERLMLLVSPWRYSAYVLYSRSLEPCSGQECYQAGSEKWKRFWIGGERLEACPHHLTTLYRAPSARANLGLPQPAGGSYPVRCAALRES
jgi:hypothetical protein